MTYEKDYTVIPLRTFYTVYLRGRETARGMMRERKRGEKKDHPLFHFPNAAKIHASLNLALQVQSHCAVGFNFSLKHYNDFVIE